MDAGRHPFLWSHDDPYLNKSDNDTPSTTTKSLSLKKLELSLNREYLPYLRSKLVAEPDEWYTEGLPDEMPGVKANGQATITGDQKKLGKNS